MTVVWEFYANAKETIGPTTMVREKTIKFDSVTINKFYQIPIPMTDELVTLANTADMDEAAHEICGKEVHWTIVNGVRTSFLMKELLTVMKTWHHFLCARLSPNSHLTEVTRERALMLYAISKSLSINVGSWILEKKNPPCNSHSHH